MPYSDPIDLDENKKKKKINPKKIFVTDKDKKNKKNLSKANLNKLEKHKAHHTSKHINLMKKLMLEGQTFTEAHNAAMKKIGK